MLEEILEKLSKLNSLCNGMTYYFLIDENRKYKYSIWESNWDGIHRIVCGDTYFDVLKELTEWMNSKEI